MRVIAATMRVVKTLEVVQHKEVASVVCLGVVYPFRHQCVDGCPNPKPQTYLHLWGGVWIMLLYLVTL